MNKKNYIFSIALSLISVFLNATPILAQDKSVNDNSNSNVTFIPSVEGSRPLDPENPDFPTRPINPDGTIPEVGTGGALSIDFSSSLDFGMNPISNRDQIYFAQAQRYTDSNLVTPDFVQVTDSRGTAGGWTLKVLELNQFEADRAKKDKVLKGARISFLLPVNVSNGDALKPESYAINDLVPNTETLVTKANAGSGAGTWITRWGGKEEIFEKTIHLGKNKRIKRAFTTAIFLAVPGTTPKENANYKSKLVWILSELPDN